MIDEEYLSEMSNRKVQQKSPAKKTNKKALTSE
jgi:hypothetical protein